MNKKELAERISNLFAPWDLEYTIDEIVFQIEHNPADVISYLLEMIEDLQA